MRLNLRNGEAVREAAEKMLKRVASIAPDARIEGFTVQAMIVKPHAQELILGLSEDPTFGPVLLFGQGGTAVEVIADRAMALPPLNSELARALIGQTRISTLLAGYRDTPAADMDGLVRAILALSEMIADCAEIVELDINPLLADEAGVLALDARVSVRRATGPAHARLAIRPYPSELEHWISLESGARLYVRPLRPEDEPQLIEFTERSSREDVRLRFHGAMRVLTHELAARLSQIDYDREMALAVFEDGNDAIMGVARLVFDPNFETAEYAIIVRTDTQGRGLGRRLVRELIDYGRSRGAKRLWGDVLSENARMLDLAQHLGAHLQFVPGSGVTRTWFELGQECSAEADLPWPSASARLPAAACLNALKVSYERVDLLRLETEFGHGGMADQHALGERLFKRIHRIAFRKRAQRGRGGVAALARFADRMAAHATGLHDRPPKRDKLRLLRTRTCAFTNVFNLVSAAHQGHASQQN